MNGVPQREVAVGVFLTRSAATLGVKDTQPQKSADAWVYPRAPSSGRRTVSICPLAHRRSKLVA